MIRGRWTGLLLTVPLGALAGPPPEDEPRPDHVAPEVEASRASERPWPEDSAAAQGREAEPRPDHVAEEIVVTAVARAATAFQSSVSVSDLEPDEIEALSARTTTEIFRNLPGVRSESSGGANNANIQVRGLPVTTGGAKFVQLQEDGLPVLSFGDITFGNTDNWLRYDRTVARIEAIRGGSASTFASNAPGAVINFVSKTGEQAGGSLALTRGLDFDTTRAEFEYGAPIARDLTFHVGGFYRLGEGAREAGYLAENGGQLKANLTRRLAAGHVRLYLKHLDDRTISYLPAPVSLAGGRAAALPTFDARTQSLGTPNLLTNTRVDATGIGTTDVRDGAHAVSTALGAELELELGDRWTVSDRARFSSNRGGFVGSFAGGVLDAATAAQTFGGTDLVYANGRRAGRTVRDGDALVVDNLLFDVAIPDLSQWVNDLRLRKQLDTTAGVFDVSIGYYKALQQVQTEWSFNFYLQQARGTDPALLDVVDASGGSLSVNGVRQFGVFDPLFDLSFDRDAVYGAIVWSRERFTLDTSIRYDSLSGRGASNLASPTAEVGGFVSRDLDVNGDGVVAAAETGIGAVDPTDLFDVDYRVDHLSFSVGTNLEVERDLALFGRFSRGGSANGDRLVLGGAGFDRGGDLVDRGLGVDMVDQVEIGGKLRSLDQIVPGYLGLFVTGFYADTEESNFEITSGRAIDRRSRALGVELEGVYQHEGFALLAGLTATDARITDDQLAPDNVGHRPRRQAALIYQLAPSWSRDGWGFGANLVGTTSSFAQDTNDLRLPGFAQLNVFARARLAEGLSAGVNVNNLTNTFGLTEAEEGSLPASGIVRARAINGRTTVATLTCTF